MANQERMRVLDLLEGGKITAEEATKLLEALNVRGGFISPETKENVEERLHTFARDVGKFAKETGSKVHVFYKDVEPKIKKAGQTALEKAASALDSLAQAIGKSLEKTAEQVAKDVCSTADACCADAEPCCKPDCADEEPREN